MNCKITHFPEPVLLKAAQPIETIDESIGQLAERMKEIMVEQKGIGLAGPQAGVNLQIFVISLDGTKENAKVYINPKIDPSGPMNTMEEGCLSLPGIYGKIPRYSRCTVHALDLDGKPFSDTGEGLYARAMQHEYDHLQGVMIKDRMGEAAKLRARRILKRLQEDYQKKQSSQGSK
ncbi:MAG: peptide deformylase [Sedimentisphaerales bacterium]|nr:peptide deformylase [Sedimentisphaerales bacterium]